MSVLIVIVGVIAGLGGGFYLAWWIKGKEAKFKELQYQDLSLKAVQLEEELKLRQGKAEELGRRLERLLTEKEFWEKKERENEQLEKRFTDSFKNLANQILEEKGASFTKQNKLNMNEILNPLQEKIQEFKDKVEKTHEESLKNYGALRNQLEVLQKTEQEITQEAQRLTKALKGDVKKQGNWGELILERILESSGLEKDREYKIQQSFTTEEGSRQQPDVIIYLPEDKQIIIDSKVSLLAYEKWATAEDEKEKDLLSKEMVKSIKAHYNGLAQKHYQGNKKINSLDFVIMFMPLEPALSIASRVEGNLFGEAYQKGVVLATPTTLMAILKTISYIWKQDKQNKNAQEIAQQTGALYDKLVNFCENFIKIGERIEQSQRTYDEALRQFSTGPGNVIGRVEKIREMGIEAKKNMPRELTSPGKKELSEGE